nr:sodium/calcium exchanger NCL2-like [Tanacetum cinerariifolium]
MGKFAKIARYAFFLIILLTIGVSGRFLHNDASELISDGADDLAQNEGSSLLQFKGIVSLEEEHCEQMYGFLPCSENTMGHFFLIVVYEYLLYHGECYVSSGGKRIFKILGPGVFGASAFQVLGFLPESLILL